MSEWPTQRAYSKLVELAKRRNVGIGGVDRTGRHIANIRRKPVRDRASENMLAKFLDLMANDILGQRAWRQRKVWSANIHQYCLRGRRLHLYSHAHRLHFNVGFIVDAQT
jgi:hypothetical protein